jgi:hypothetical protein
MANLDAECSELRLQLKTFGTEIMKLKVGYGTDAMPMPAGANYGEAIANLMLAYRHIEDAAMRLGKAIQAHDGGKSVYDDKDAMRTKPPAA